MTDNNSSAREFLLDNVLAFARHSLEKLTPANRSRLADTLQQVPLLCAFAGPSQFDAMAEVRMMARGVLRPPRQKDHLSQRELRALHQELRRLLDRVIPRDPTAPGEDWTVPTEIREIRLGARSLRRRLLVEWPGSFWLSCTELLSEFRDRLTRCDNAECGAVFLKARSDSRFCSPPCSKKIRNKEYYDANYKKLSKRRHAAYIERVRRTHKNAKVNERPRIRRKEK